MCSRVASLNILLRVYWATGTPQVRLLNDCITCVAGQCCCPLTRRRRCQGRRLRQPRGRRAGQSGHRVAQGGRSGQPRHRCSQDWRLWQPWRCAAGLKLSWRISGRLLDCLMQPLLQQSKGPSIEACGSSQLQDCTTRCRLAHCSPASLVCSYTSSSDSMLAISTCIQMQMWCIAGGQSQWPTSCTMRSGLLCMVAY